MDAVRCLAGRGAGMVLVRRTPPSLQLLDADASGGSGSANNDATARKSSARMHYTPA